MLFNSSSTFSFLSSSTVKFSEFCTCTCVNIKKERGGEWKIYWNIKQIVRVKISSSS